MTKEIQERPRGEQAWIEVLARQEASGLSVREFSRREGLKDSSLYEWRRRVRARSAERASTGQVRASCDEQPVRSCGNGGSSFIDIGALGSSSARWEVRLDLGCGMVLTLVRS